MRAATLAFCLALAACTQFPELEGTVAPDLENADFPELVPLDPLMEGAGRVVENPGETTQALEARVASLRDRASALQRRTIVDGDARERLDAASN